MNVEEWLNLSVQPSSELVRQLLSEPPERRLIGDYLVKDEDIEVLRTYLSRMLNEFTTAEETMVDSYPTGTTPPPSQLFP